MGRAEALKTGCEELGWFIQTDITNAGLGGTSWVIKTVDRDAYGVRNPVNQRLRTRCVTTAKDEAFSPSLSLEEPDWSKGKRVSLSGRVMKSR